MISHESRHARHPPQDSDVSAKLLHFENDCIPQSVSKGQRLAELVSAQLLGMIWGGQVGGISLRIV